MSDTESSRRIKWLIIGVVLVGGIAFALVKCLGSGSKSEPDQISKAFAKRVLSGHSVTLKNNEELIYLGIRAPYENEPLFEEAKNRNGDLVIGKTLRLQYESEQRDRKGRLWAYAFLQDDTFINKVLVQEGLAYARLTPDVVRHADELLAAQQEARRKKLGIWLEQKPSDEPQYVADPKYAEFHRSSCAIAEKIKPERRMLFPSKDAAFDKGFAPCNKCLP